MLDREKDNQPLDLSYLSEMSGDSPEFMIEMLEMFEQQTPGYMKDLEQAIDNQDWTKVSGYAHKIKPTFSYIGRPDVKEHLQAIEHDARELKALDTMPQKYEALNDFVQVLYKQLELAKADLKKRL